MVFFVCTHLKTVPALAFGAVAPVAIHWLGKEVVEADQSSVDIGLSLLCCLSLEPALFTIAVEQTSGYVGGDRAGRGPDERVDGCVSGSEETCVDVVTAIDAVAAATSNIKPLASRINV